MRSILFTGSIPLDAVMQGDADAEGGPGARH
jgi:hypothetical protein